MDFEFIREQTPLYIEAAKLTLHMAVIGVLLAIVVGLVCSMIKYFRIPVLRQIVECYIELSRNTPLLIQLFFLYFGLPKIGQAFIVLIFCHLSLFLLDLKSK